MKSLVGAVIAFAGLPVQMPVIIIAIIIIAAILALGSVLLLRSGGKKGSKVTPGSGSSDWQRQAVQQPGAAGNWNPQGAPGNWNPQGGPGGWGQPVQQQQPGGWGTADAGGNWGAPAQQPGGWGAPSPAQPANSWDAAGNQAMPGQPAQPGWGAPQQPAANSWGAPQQPAANSWGNQGAQAPWDQPAQPAQDPWGQPAQSANPWGAPAAQPSPPQQGQQPQTAYGAHSSGPSWGQGGVGGAQQADPWSAQAAQQPANQWGSPAAPAPVGSPAGTPPWQQGGFGQGAPGIMQDPSMFANNDGDKTMLRTTGPQGGLGFVRVEEGKEPGRVYEVRKEALSIGRSRESDIFLEDLAVSRLHASIVNMGNGNYALRDEGSANGSKVNGQLVSKNQTYPLQEGDRIQLGQTVLVFGRH
ncbi:MAG: FHA domain-containing protein [Ktedonobacteraceae bacterium]|nr:FHA domain-containing protein [Ktedonobacteraceae bacterium]